MSGVVGLALLRPWWLPLGGLLVAVLYARLRRKRIGDWDRVIDPHLYRAMGDLGRCDGAAAARPWRHPLLWAVAVASVALAGPSVTVRDARAFRNLDGAIFVIDISPSMTESAAWPAVVTIARGSLAALGSRPAGLVVYGGDAYVASELTSDLAQIGFTLSLIDPQTMPDPGSRPALGLALAAEMLREARIVAGDVVWITDGGGVDAGLAGPLAMLRDLGAALTIVDTGTGPDGALALVERLTDAPVLTLSEGAALDDRLSPDRVAARLGRIDIALIGRADLGRYLALAVLACLAFRMRRPA